MSGRRDPQGGSLAIEAAILAPAIVLMFCGAVALGRLETVSGTVDSAARAGARSVSLNRSTDSDEKVATDSVTAVLAGQGVDCPGLRVDVRRTPLTVGPTEQLTLVKVDFTCSVPVSDLFPVGVLPGGVSVQGSYESVIDRYRSQ